MGSDAPAAAAPAVPKPITPAPAVKPVWHLADVLVWMKENNKVDALKAAQLLESTQVIKTFNAAVSASSLDKSRDARLIELAHRVAL